MTAPATSAELAALLHQAKPFIYRASEQAKPHAQDRLDARELLPRVTETLARAPTPKLTVSADGGRVDAHAQASKDAWAAVATARATPVPSSSSAAVVGLVRRVLAGRPIKPWHEIAAIVAAMGGPVEADTRARAWIREHIAPIWPEIAGFKLSNTADKQAREIISLYRHGLIAWNPDVRGRMQTLAASLPAHGFDLELGTEIPVGPYWDGRHGWQTWREHMEVTRAHALAATPDEQLWGLADMRGTATWVRLLTSQHPDRHGFLINPGDLVIAAQ